MDKSENINNFHQLFGHVSQKRHIWLITIFSKAHQKKRSEQIDPVKTHNKPISQNKPPIRTVVNITRFYFKNSLINMGSSQRCSFALILWDLSKTIPSLQQLSLYSSRISFDYFNDNVNLVPVPEGGLQYCQNNSLINIILVKLKIYQFFFQIQLPRQFFPFNRVFCIRTSAGLFLIHS